MLLINYHTASMLERINETLEIKLPIARQFYITIFDAPEEIPMSKKFQWLLNKYPKADVIFIYNKNKTTSTENDNLFMYKNEWKLVPQLLARDTQVMFFGTEQDHYVKVSKKIKHIDSNNQVQEKEIKSFGEGMYADGIAKVIGDIHAKIKEPRSVAERSLREFLKEHAPSEEEQIIQGIKANITNQNFITRLDIAFKGLEAEEDLLRDIEHKVSDADVAFFKMLYLLWYKATQDNAFIRKFEGTAKQNEFDQPEMYAQTFIYAIKALIGFELSLESIFEEIPEISTYSEEYLEGQYENEMIKDNYDELEPEGV